MRAITIDRYGPPEVLQLQTLPEPVLGDEDVLVEVRATSVTTADWRFRTATFPRGMRLLGRLVAGLFKPRQRVPGRDFAGRVLAVGKHVTRFQPGDDVFGVNPRGASAERIVVPADGPLVRIPAGLTHAEAAALPFGGITAVVFLTEMAKVQPGERVLVMGASGGVGIYAVQVAKHLGAEVTGVCSGSNADLVRSGGADHVIDYRREDPRSLGRMWDVIIDPVGKTTFADYRSSLSEHGRHVFIEAGPREIWQSIITPRQKGPTVVFGVSADDLEGFEKLCAVVEAGGIRPVIGHRFPFEEMVEAHRVVEARRRRGAVIVDVVAEGEGVMPLRRAG